MIARTVKSNSKGQIIQDFLRNLMIFLRYWVE